ncbi:MAG: carboxypeptidase regulatory-like domain-containing protein, partial [Planctomycetota bacterium]
TTRVELIELQAGDHNLLQRINRANPKPIPVSDPILTMDVSGTVLDADGQPVKDAVVLLRESSTTRISAASAFVETPEELYLRETADVLARTTSDASGKFEFHQIDAPGIPRRSADRSWAGDVVAAHPKYGICSIPIQSTASRRQNFNDLQATLTETTSLSGTYSTSEGEPVAGVVVTLDRLLTGSKSDRYTDGFDLQASQLNLRAITDSEGRFEFEQIPRSMLASLWVHDPDSAGAFVLAGTSPDVDSSKVDPSAVARYGPLAERPHAIVADPGVLVKGIIRDESGSPVADAMVVFGGMVLRHRSGADGSVSIRVASRTMDSYRRDSYRRRTNPSPSVPVSIYTDQERGFMRTAHQLPVIGIDDGKPFKVTLQKGVRIEGVVVDQSGDPIEGIAVMNTSRETLGRGTSDEAGRYEMILPVGKHTLLFATDKFGFRLPNTREAYQRRDNLDDLLTLTIDIENDDPHKLPKTVIPEADTIQVIASLPDGKPAKGADAVVRDEKVLNADTRFPPQRVERSSNVLTNSIGRADLPVQGVLTEKAYVDLSLIDGDIAYYGSAMASEVVDGVLPIVLRQSPILEGRVSIDGKPYAGVVLSVGESQPISRSADGRRFNGFQTSNHQAVTTDADGFYRLPVKQDKRYSVSVSTLPGESTRPSVGYGAHAVGAGKISVREFQFRRGSGTIAGRVVDANGVGIAEADVRIQRERDTTPSFWIGHYDESTMTTNADGYFELKRVPEGTYQVRVSGKRPENRTQRAPSTMFAASTGQADLTVTLSDANAAAPLPRLTPVRIESVNPQR